MTASPLRRARARPEVLPDWILPTVFALVALAVWEGPARHLEPWSGVGLTDIPTYERSADASAAGQLPYRDITLEYPPGAAAIFYLARFLPGDTYTDSFRMLMLGAWMLATAGAVAAAIALRCSQNRQVAVGAIMAATPLLLGSLIGTRYDAAVTAAFAWLLVAAVRQRWRWMWGLLVLAILLKLMPVILGPCLAIWQAHRVGWQATLRSVAGAAAALIALVVPVAIAAPSGLWAMVAYHLEPPAQLESSASAAVLLWHLITGFPVSVVSSFGSQGPVGRLPEVLASLTTVAAFVLLLVIAGSYAWRVRRPGAAQTPGYLVATLAGSIVVLAVGSKVLSPQYLLWFVPAVLLLPGRWGRIALVLMPALMLLTQGYFPARYWDLVALAPYPIVLLVARDLLLIVLAVACWPRAPRP